MGMLGVGVGVVASALRGLVNAIARLFAANEPGLWIDPFDLSTLFQDTAGTTPVTGPGQQVALALDKSGRGGRLIQPTALARPTLGRHPVGGRRNLLTQTEFPNGVANAPATGGAVTAVTDIEGGRTGLAFDNTTATCFAHKTPAATVGTTYTFGFDVEMGDGSPPVFGDAGNPNSGLNTFAALISGTLYVPSLIERIGLKTWRVKASGTANATTIYVGVQQSSTNQQRRIKVTGFQLEAGSAVTPYQKVTSDWDVTEAGKRDCYYLGFDGVDDFMITAAPLDLSSTSAVSIFAGFRKEGALNEGFRPLLELGNELASTPYTFLVAAPSSPNRNNLAFHIRGAGAGAASFTPDNSSRPPVSLVLTAIGDTVAKSTIRQNGVQYSVVNTGGGGALAASRTLNLGKRVGTSLCLKMFLYQLAIRGADTPDTQVIPVEALIADKMGLTS